MIYKNKFNLTGTDQQQAIVKEALDTIYFPWDRLKFPTEPVEIGWRDLNHGETLNMVADPKARFHQGGTIGIINGRKWTMGVMYPSSGRIYIDLQMVNFPQLAKTTVSAEIAHNVDYFLVRADGGIGMTDKQRDEIMALMHGGNYADHGHSWWEKFDYGTEYFTLVGESFMQAFTLAYSDMPFDNTSDFTHSITKEQVPALRKILGIERTDYIPLPEPRPEPVATYKTFPPSTIYHRLTHYPTRKGKTVTNLTGLKPCKICKP